MTALCPQVNEKPSNTVPMAGSELHTVILSDALHLGKASSEDTRSVESRIHFQFPLKSVAFFFTDPNRSGLSWAKKQGRCFIQTYNFHAHINCQ